MASITNLQKNKTLFILCNSGEEILYIDYDHNMSIADIAIYESRTDYLYKMSFWQRILCCWQVLWNKKTNLDKITLKKAKLLELKNFLVSLDLN